jgi:hypothetical protein
MEILHMEDGEQKNEAIENAAANALLIGFMGGMHRNKSKAEIMAVAIQTTRQAMYLERRACAQMLLDMADADDEGAVCTALRNAAEEILNRVPAQRQ